MRSRHKVLDHNLRDESNPLEVLHGHLSRAPGGRSSLPDPTVWFQSPYCMVPKQPLLYGSQQAKLLTKKLLSLPCKDAVRLREAPTNIHITNMNAANHVHARRLIFSYKRAIANSKPKTAHPSDPIVSHAPMAPCELRQFTKLENRQIHLHLLVHHLTHRAAQW